MARVMPVVTHRNVCNVSLTMMFVILDDDLAQDRDGNELSGSIKCGEFID